MTTEELRAIRERWALFRSEHNVIRGGFMDKEEFPIHALLDVNALLSHIEELTTQFAQEVEENARLKKEIERLSAQLQVATVDLVLAQKRKQSS